MKRLHVRCPLCGKIGWHDNIPRDTLYDIELLLQEFGGNVSAPDKTSGVKRRGRMVWVNVTNPDPDQWSQIIEQITQNVKLLAIRLGIPVSEAIDIFMPIGSPSEIDYVSSYGGTEVDVGGESWK